MTEPTDAEAWEMWLSQPLTGHAPKSVGNFARAALARWGTPQPVVREPLSDAQIAEMMRDTWGCASIAPRHAEAFARSVEAEVRKDDDALILQLVEALEKADKISGYPNNRKTITAGRARLGRPHD